ncbi:hypothetical protein GCM10027271_58360 [Saccharopolyspora gloriosae]
MLGGHTHPLRVCVQASPCTVVLVLWLVSEEAAAVPLIDPPRDSIRKDSF